MRARTGTADRLSNGRLAAFASPGVPLAALGLPLVVHLPPYYVKELGLTLGAVGFAWMAVRLLDMVFDPLFGGVMDRTRSRFGRFRLWLAIGAPVVMLASYMMFMAQPGVGVGYLWIWLLVIYAGQSMATLSHMAWGSTLSGDYDQRSRIYGWWQASNVLGMIVVLLLPTILERFFGLSTAQGVRAMGWFVILLLPLSLLLAFANAKEPVLTTPKDRSGLRDYLGLLKRKSVQRLLLCDIVLNTGPAITGALFFFFFESIKGFRHADANLLLLGYFLGAFGGGPLWVKLAYRLGKHRTLALAGVMYAVIQMMVILMPPNNMAVAAVLMVLAGLPYSAGPFLLRAMMADVGDEERLATGKDRTGLLYAVLTGSIKIGAALAVFLSYQGLELVGYDAKAGAENSGAALNGLLIFFTLVPATLGLLAAMTMWGYPLTSARQSEIRRELEARDLHERELAEAAPDLSAEPRLSQEVHAAVPPLDAAARAVP